MRNPLRKRKIKDSFPSEESLQQQSDTLYAREIAEIALRQANDDATQQTNMDAAADIVERLKQRPDKSDEQ